MSALIHLLEALDTAPTLADRTIASAAIADWVIHHKDWLLAVDGLRLAALNLIFDEVSRANYDALDAERKTTLDLVDRIMHEHDVKQADAVRYATAARLRVGGGLGDAGNITKTGASAVASGKTGALGTSGGPKAGGE